MAMVHFCPAPLEIRGSRARNGEDEQCVGGRTVPKNSLSVVQPPNLMVTTWRQWRKSKSCIIWREHRADLSVEHSLTASKHGVFGVTCKHASKE